MNTMKLLAEDTARECYAKIENRINEDHLRSDDLGEFRRILEWVFCEIGEDVRSFWTSLAGKMHFVRMHHAIPSSIMNEAQSLRKYSNTFSHGWPEIDNEKYLASIKAIAETIFFFSSVPIPRRITDYYYDYLPLTLIDPLENCFETIPFDRVIVLEIQEPQSNNPHSCWKLVCESEGKFGQYQLKLKDFENIRFSNIGKMVEKYSTLNLFNLSKDKNRYNSYHTYRNTKIVLEPDYLINASYVARAFFDNPNGAQESNGILPFLGTFFGVESKASLFMGDIANDLLDNTINQKKGDFDELFDHIQNGEIWKSVKLGEKEMGTLRDEARSLHYPNFSPLPFDLVGKQTSIEPSFYSPMYGLEGRFDVLIEEPSNPMRKDILELKAGRPPENGMVKAEHKMQVVAYNLILKSVFGHSRKGKSEVFYSKAQADMLRNVPPRFEEEQRLIMLRNIIVATRMKVANGNYDPIHHLAQRKSLKRPRYLNERLDLFRYAYKKANLTEHSYFNEFVGFVLRELQTAKIGDANPKESKKSGFSGFWKDSREDKKLNLRMLGELKFVKSATTSDGRQQMEFIVGVGGEYASDFREKDYVLIYPEDVESPVHCQILKGSIAKIDSERIKIRLNNPQIDSSFFKSHTTWAIEHGVMEKGLTDQLQSMFNFLSSSPRKKRLLLGQEKPRFIQERITLDLDLMDVEPTGSQSNAIKLALSARDYALIQGPPGTGKTSRVLLYILLHILRRTDETIFLLAFTNKAVQKIIETIEKYNLETKQLKIEFIRLAGSSDKGPNTLPAIAESLTISQTEDKLLKTKVFIGTLNSFQIHRNLIPGDISKDTLIVDEASQLTEPQLAGILPDFNRFILIGDHNQLPAVVTQREVFCKNQDENLKKIGIRDFRTSLFERLWKQAKRKKWTRATITLTEHFRMHGEIAALVNHYYNHALKHDTKRQSAPLGPSLSKNRLGHHILSNRIIFIESTKGSGKSHDEEAHRVVQLIGILTSNEEKGRIGVIAPWRAQINTIKQKLPSQKKSREILVDTVERFQGSERNTIIVSLATSQLHQLRNLESIYDNEYGIEVDRKLNVALSRAEDRLIILGEPEVLGQSKHYRRLMQKIRSKGCYIDQETAQELFNKQNP